VSDVAISVVGLRKRYGDVEAVSGLDLAVGTGEVFALLGPNGAGKTTTVEILEGYRQRDAGEATVLGHDPARRERALRERVGIVLQSTGIDPYLTVRETVELYARYYPSPRDPDEVVELVGLAEKRDTRVLKLSGGQQRRLDVAIALAGDPELLFLDEPTTGFDPGARRNAWQIVRNLSDLGKTVFLTTHYMDEAQHLADRVAVIARGEIVAEGPPSTLGGRHLAESVIRFRRPDGQLPPAFEAQVRIAGEDAELRVSEPTKALHELTAWALGRGIELEGLQVSRPTLEDVYLDLTDGEGGSG
jgi:ABC-2 type transport system ATP-binding protein